jgi:hypothetical protein
MRDQGRIVQAAVSPAPLFNQSEKRRHLVQPIVALVGVKECHALLRWEAGPMSAERL